MAKGKKKGRVRIKQKAQVRKKGEGKKMPKIPLTPHDNSASIKVKIKKK